MTDRYIKYVNNTINDKAKKKLIKIVAQKEYSFDDKKKKIIGSNFKIILLNDCRKEK